MSGVPRGVSSSFIPASDLFTSAASLLTFEGKNVTVLSFPQHLLIYYGG